MAPKNSGKQTTAAPKPAPLASDPKFYKGPTVSASATGKKNISVSTKLSDNALRMANSASPSPRTKRPTPAALPRRPSRLRTLFVNALLVWAITSLFFCSPNYSPETTSTLCVPASRYHSAVQPYVQPHIDHVKQLAHSHLEPHYGPHLHHLDSARDFILPKAQAVQRLSTPYVEALHRGWIRLYRTHVAPRVHYGKLRVGKVIRPYKTQAELRWKVLVKPHLQRAEKRVREVVEKVQRDERVKLVRVKAGELVVMARELAVKGVQVTKKGWEQGKPLAVQGWKETNRHWKGTVVPVGVRSFELARTHGYQGAVVASSYLAQANETVLSPALQHLNSLYIAKVYRPYLAQHIEPVIAKVSPVVSTAYNTLARIATPFYRQVVRLASPYYYHYFPKAPPPPPPTFIEKVQSVFTPSTPSVEPEIPSVPVVTPAVVVPPAEPAVATKEAEKTAEEEDDEEDEAFLAELEGAKDPSKVGVPKHAVVPEPEATPAEESEEEAKERQQRHLEEVKEKRREIERDHDNWEAKIQKTGEVEEEKVLEKLASIRRRSVAAFPSISHTWTASIEREANKLAKSLDKYFTRSTGLKNEEIEKAVAKAGERFASKIEETSGKVNGWLEDVETKEEEIVHESFEKVNGVANQATGELGMPYAWLDDVSVQDWTRFHKLPQMALDWAEKYRFHSTSADHPLLATPETDMDALVNSFKDEMNEIEDGFAARVGILKTNAILKADADDRKARGLDAEDDSELLFPIGFIWGNSDSSSDSDASDPASPILAKGKQQILEALASASSVVAPAPVSTASGLVASASEAILGAATTSAGNVVEHATASAASLASEASEIVFGAATTSAGNVVEHATASLASVASQASEAVLGAATTSAGNVVEQASASASSVVSQASEAVLGAATTSAGNPIIPIPSVVASASSAAASVLEDASASIHSATRVVVKAAGGTPTPETAGEYVEEVVARVRGAVSGEL